jgi:hypothetical protein
MPFDGNGQFKRVHSWQEDKENGIKILSDRHDAEDDNFALGLSQCLTKDAQGAPLADFNWGNNKITNLKEGSASKDAVNMSQLQKNNMFCEDISPVANIITVLVSPNISELSNGMTFTVRVNNTNTSADVRLEVNSINAVPVVNSSGAALIAGDIAQNSICRFMYYNNVFLADISQSFPAGISIAYRGVSAPKGRWLLCEGAAVSRTTYAALFGAIGTTYGEGDGETTFNLPDDRGVFHRGLGGASDVLGIVQGDAIRNITGWSSSGISYTYNLDAKGGAMYRDGTNRGYKENCSNGSGDRLHFDASLVVPTAAENRPVNTAVRYFISY